MIQRKKSLATYCRDKKLREGKPLFTPILATGLKRKGAVGRLSKPQEGSQPARKPRTGLKRVSSKRAKENRKYTTQRKAFLIANPLCEACTYDRIHRCMINRSDMTGSRADQIHHKDGREGDLLLDESKWMAICGPHHDFIHQHPNEARKRGWLV